MEITGPSTTEDIYFLFVNFLQIDSQSFEQLFAGDEEQEQDREFLQRTTANRLRFQVLIPEGDDEDPGLNYKIPEPTLPETLTGFDEVIFIIAFYACGSFSSN